MRKGMPDKWKVQRMIHQIMLVFAMGIAVGAFTAVTTTGPNFIDHMEYRVASASETVVDWAVGERQALALSPFDKGETKRGYVDEAITPTRTPRHPKP